MDGEFISEDSFATRGIRDWEMECSPMLALGWILIKFLGKTGWVRLFVSVRSA